MEKEKHVHIISFMAPINDNTVGRLIDIAYNAHEEGASEIHLFLSSIGGKLHPAFTGYYFFRSLRVPFYAHNVGTIETSALMLYLASDYRASSPNSKFMFYSFEWTFYRDHIRFPEIIEAYESLKFDADSYAAIFNARTNGSYDIKSCLTGPAQVLNAQQAIEAGIVTTQQITPAGIPELAKLWLIHS